MDAYIPQYKLSPLIELSIGEKLKEYQFTMFGQADRACHYKNDKIEMRISYFHKEVGINFKSMDKTIHSSDIINKCRKETVELNRTEDSFENIEEYFKYILRNEFLNVERCMPGVFYGNF